MLAYMSPSPTSTASPAGPSSPNLPPHAHTPPPHNLQPLALGNTTSIHNPHHLPPHLVASTSGSGSGTPSLSSARVSATASPFSHQLHRPTKGPGPLGHIAGDRSLSAPPSALPSPKMEAMAAPSPLPHHLNERLLSVGVSGRGTWSPYKMGPAPNGTPTLDDPSRTGSSHATTTTTTDSPAPLAGQGLSKSATARLFPAATFEKPASPEPRVRRCANLGDAMSVLEAILMGDATDSSGSSSEDEERGGFEMDEDRMGGGMIREEDEEEEDDEDRKRKAQAEKYRRQPHRGLPTPTTSPTSSTRRPLPRHHHATKRGYQPNSAAQHGWSKGLATLSTHFQFIVDVPVWSPETTTDLSTLLQVRDDTLKALHHIIDGLRLRGVRASYRLMSISSTNEAHPADEAPYGCIRIAPFLVPTVSKRLPMQPLAYINSAGQPASASSHNPAVSPISPANLLSMRRSTVAVSNQPSAGPEHGMSTSLSVGFAPTGHGRKASLAVGPSSSSSSFGSSFKECGGAGRLSALGPGGQTVDEGDEEKEDVKKKVQAAIERDRNGIALEGRSFLIAIHGQPALVIT